MFKKVIIWGYPLYSHTQSYIQSGWYNAFKYLGYDTYWFHDGEYPDSNSFDYKDCLFLTEGYADSNIPLEKSSIYFVHMCKNPAKYISNEVRLIDNRFLLDIADDWVYSYRLADLSLQKINNYTYYESNANDNALAVNIRNNIYGYEAFYSYWASDLLPQQINYDNIYLKRDRVMYFIGTIMDYNRDVIEKLISGLRKNNIEFIHSDPWKEPKNTEQCMHLIQKSYIAPDVRASSNLYYDKEYLCTNHKLTGWVSCRTFKNISYGQLGITNSKKTFELFEGDIVYCDNEEELVDLAITQRENYDMIKRQMLYVKENHTFLNRAKDLIGVL